PPRVQPPLAPLHLTVQVVARELADDITPQVDLLEMAAPVVQVPQRPPVRHLRFCAVALNIVPVLQHALRQKCPFPKPSAVIRWATSASATRTAKPT
ncbi:hypothetical protein ACLLVO_003308, partial [Salmonella enterica]|nr:hypothetical protein [Salmonella enterica subsp. enterica serovar Kentucky]ELC5319310.1 hypothetical protein [Salmonella enterica subsp. enterica serovar Kentucky]